MKRLMMTAAALALMATTAHANVQLNVTGNWSTHLITTTSDGTPLCLMRATWKSPGSPIIGKVMVKWNSADNATFIHVYKSNWKFSADVEVPLVVSFDNGAREATGITFIGDDNNSRMIEIPIPDDKVEGVLEDFASAKQLTITFQSGNEQPWVGKMVGSRAAVAWFNLCKVKLGGTGVFTPRRTSPVPQATPTSPVAPTKPAGKNKDDGSV
jgi:hypothetical protein